MHNSVHIPAAVLSEIVDLMANGIPIRRIAVENGFSASTIRNRLIEEGLPHNIGLAKEWAQDRDTAWSRHFDDIADANEGVDIPVVGRPELSSFNGLRSDLGIRDISAASLVEAVFEWDGRFWCLVRSRYYPFSRTISLLWPTKLTTGKQAIEALDKVRTQEERVRFQARIWLHKLPSGHLLIYPATVVSKGYPLYQKVA